MVDVSGSTNEVGPKSVAGADFREVNLAAIVLNSRQPREIFDGEPLEELAVSNREAPLDSSCAQPGVAATSLLWGSAADARASGILVS
jgi:hypothetical protein